MKSKKLIKLSNTEPTQDKEAAILEAYLVCARKEGVEHVTLQKVAAAAGLAYGTVHYYFGNEGRDLLQSAMAYVAAASARYMEAALAPAAPGAKANGVKAYIDAKFAWAEAFPTYASMLCYFIYQASRDKRAAVAAEAMRTEQGAKVAALVLQEIGKGRYPRRGDLPQLAERIQLVLAGAQLAALGQSAARAKQWRHHAWSLVEGLLEKA